MANTDDLVVRDDVPGIDPVQGTTYSEAIEALGNYNAVHPLERGRLQIVAKHEVAEAIS